MPANRHNAGTLGRLIAEYYTAVDYANLKSSSRTLYRIVLDPISRQHGHRLVKDMGRENARKIIETIGATKPGMANLTRAVLKRVLRYAVDRGWRNDNPAAGIAPYKIGTRHTWSDEQLEAYEARWKLGTRERLAYATLLYSGQRGGDVVKMARPKGATVKLVQEKTGTEMVIPVHPIWREAITAGPSNGVRLIGDERGRPIKRPALTLLIRRAAEAAGLPSRMHRARIAEGSISTAGGRRTLVETNRGDDRPQVSARDRALHRRSSQAKLAMQAMSKLSTIRHSRGRKP